MEARGLLGEKTISLRSKMVFHLLFILSEDFKPPLSIFKEKKICGLKPLMKERKEKKSKEEEENKENLRGCFVLQC